MKRQIIMSAVRPVAASNALREVVQSDSTDQVLFERGVRRAHYAIGCAVSLLSCKVKAYLLIRNTTDNLCHLQTSVCSLF